jgi:putative membrane protein
MTAVAPASEPAAPERRGWHVPNWAAITGGILLLVVALLGVLRAIRLHRRERFGRGFGRFGDNVGNGHVHWLLWVIVILAAAAGIALLVAALRHRGEAASVTTAVAAPAARTASPDTAPAAQILAERFARGEIDEAEYISRRDALRG